ncbi:hypothetical protein NC99_39680 [Sunxiuqinia dokdonensis]|uniref:Uncharacterized protein n=1 Tax=Sunxiuqinia dokdonensis TaxID=1409788 RepID=A0A0L8V4X6_9BACT|nr:hypothetical protein NC99_39680 [Sunxiuqinia dokdonensis]
MPGGTATRVWRIRISFKIGFLTDKFKKSVMSGKTFVG